MTVPGLANPEAVTHCLGRLLVYAAKSVWPRFAFPPLQALRLLFAHTAAPDWRDRLVATSLIAKEELAQRPARRAFAAAIVSLLRELNPPTDVAADYQEVVAQWEQAVTESPYPDVQRAWASPREALR